MRRIPTASLVLESRALRLVSVAAHGGDLSKQWCARVREVQVTALKLFYMFLVSGGGSSVQYRSELLVRIHRNGQDSASVPKGAKRATVRLPSLFINCGEM